MVFYGYEIAQFQTDRADPRAEVETNAGLSVKLEYLIPHTSVLILLVRLLGNFRLVYETTRINGRDI